MSHFNDGAAATWTSEPTLGDLASLVASVGEGYEPLRIGHDRHGYVVSFGGVQVAANTLTVAVRRLLEIHRDRVRLHGGAR